MMCPTSFPLSFLFQPSHTSVSKVWLVKRLYPTRVILSFFSFWHYMCSIFLEGVYGLFFLNKEELKNGYIYLPFGEDFSSAELAVLGS